MAVIEWPRLRGERSVLDKCLFRASNRELLKDKLLKSHRQTHILVLKRTKNGVCHAKINAQ